jgi:hypothetical protein
MLDLSKKYHFEKFNQDKRGSFTYWYYHWKAFNLTAFHLGCWKFKYLFHDIEKPWLMLFWRSYIRVQYYHRWNSNHHIEYKYKDKIDWEAVVIDWECSRFTKYASPRNAYHELCYIESDVFPDFYKFIKQNMIPVLIRLGLDE